MKRYIVLLSFIVSALISVAQQKEKINLILDTDIGPDYDDVGAVAMLHTLADKNEVNILGTISCNHHYLVAPTLEILNNYFGRPNIPIAVPTGVGASLRAVQKWPQLLIEKYPTKSKSNDDFPDAVSTYRKLLAEAKDTSVVITAVGFLNNISDLLNSKKDKYSNLSGKDLISKKVKLLVSMAGCFPSGREYNVFKDTVSAANVFNNWPTEIIFTGLEIGREIKTGLRLMANTSLKNSPVKDVYAHSIPQRSEDSLGRMSWDQTAVLIAVRGIEPYFGKVRGKFKLEKNGANSWILDPNGKHYYVTKKMDFRDLEVLIEDLMMR